MDSKLEGSQEENGTGDVPEKGEENVAIQTNENEGIDNLKNNEEQPVETNSELATSENTELAEEQEDATRRDSKLAKSSRLSHGIPKRYALLFLVFLGFVNIYGLRINLNVALVAMVNNHTYTRGGVTVQEPAEFHWNSKTQGKDPACSQAWNVD